MSQDILARVRGLDDLAAVNLIRYLGRMLFKDPDIRSLLAFEAPTGALAALATLPSYQKQELLDTKRSIWLARKLLIMFASQARFSEILARAMDSPPRDELVLEATVPRGLTTDLVRLLECAQIADGSSMERRLLAGSMDRLAGSADRTDHEVANRYHAPEILVDLARVATGEVLPLEASQAQATPEAKGIPSMRSPLREVYPDIAVDEVHPVAGATVNFSVKLAAQRITTTKGEVQLPDSPPEVEHTLQVHLLFGTASAWDTLIWSAARGTVKAASFSLSAPPTKSERALVEARANFYLEKRWCGEGQRNLDVRGAPTVAPRAEIPLPDLPPWRRGLVLQPDALPPDFIVRIQKGAVEGDFLWSCLSPHREFSPPEKEGDDRWSLKDDAATFVRKTFAPFANMPLDRVQMADVEGAGEEIYCNTSTYFRDCYWALWHAAEASGFRFESVQIVTDEPCVPWELMRLSDLKRAPDVAPEFLGIRHCVGRWLAVESASMRQQIVVNKVAVSASSYEGISKVSPKLPWAAKERQFLIDNYCATSIPLTSDAMLNFLEGGGAQAVHLACHGKMLITDPNASVLMMEDTPKDLKPRSIARRAVCDGLGAQHPLVFLNACEVGGAAASMSLVAGFPRAFLYAGASALVSPLWAVNDEHALEIAEEFYKEVFLPSGGKPLGAVLRDVRARVKAKPHLTYLAYVLYGDPMAQVDYQPK